jgi:hypothetical protein
MSLSLTLTEIIKTFINKVSDKYDIDKTELEGLWEGEELKSSNQVSKPKKIVKELKESTKIDQDLNPDVLLKCNKAELIALCKTHGKKCSGTKSILVNRLLGKDETDESVKIKTKITKQEVVKDVPVIKKLTANIPNILIRRNKFNNYEHPETSLIFDNETKLVIGKQKDDGTIDQLTEDDIDQCNAFKFKFKIPRDLDQKLNLGDVKVDELSEDEEKELVEEEDELVEEEELVEEDLDEDEFEEYVSEDE